jgi:hypothetical protein
MRDARRGSETRLQRLVWGAIYSNKGEYERLGWTAIDRVE